MLNACFGHMPNPRLHTPKKTEITEPVAGDRFEERAFNALFESKETLGIGQLYRCHAARMDGYLVTTVGETVLLEMKECLGWGAVQAASAQFLMGRKLLELKATRAIIVFERISDEWSRILPSGGWGQLALHASELSPHIEIGGLLIRDGSPVGPSKIVHPL